MVGAMDKAGVYPFMGGSDREKRIATFWGHTTDVQCFAFSEDGTLLVSGGHDGSILLWDLTPYL